MTAKQQPSEDETTLGGPGRWVEAPGFDTPSIYTPTTDGRVNVDERREAVAQATRTDMYEAASLAWGLDDHEGAILQLQAPVISLIVQSAIQMLNVLPLAEAAFVHSVTQALHDYLRLANLVGSHGHYGTEAEAWASEGVTRITPELTRFISSAVDGAWGDEVVTTNANLAFGGVVKAAFWNGVITEQSKGRQAPIMVVWRTEQDDKVCPNCDLREAEVFFEVKDMPGLPGEGQFNSESCLNGPTCRCYLTVDPRRSS